MSSGARIFLGIAALAFSGMCGYVALAGTIPKNVWIMWVIAGICFMITLACIPGRHAHWIGRSLAGIVALGSVGYLIAMAFEPPDPSGVTSIWKAIGLFSAWGLPSGWYAAVGRAPSFGRLKRMMENLKAP